MGAGSIRLQADRPGSGPDSSGPRAGARPSRCRHSVDRRVPPFAGGRLPRADRRGRGGQEPMRFSWTRVGAILRKELRDYRRNRFVIVTMTMVPVVFIIAPMIQLFVANATADTAHLNTHVGLSLLYLLV